MTTIFKNWDFIRVLRLLMGLWVGYSAVVDKQPYLLGFSLIFLTQAILNIGCCGVGGCQTNYKTAQNDSNVEEVSYEEVK